MYLQALVVSVCSSENVLSQSGGMNRLGVVPGAIKPEEYYYIWAIRRNC